MSSHSGPELCTVGFAPTDGGLDCARTVCSCPELAAQVSVVQSRATCHTVIQAQAHHAHHTSLITEARVQALTSVLKLKTYLC